MSINTDTYIKRVPLTPDIENAIKQECEIQSARDNARRLVAAFEAQNSVILIFQIAADK